MGIASVAVRNKHRADPEVREARQRGHELFDQLWQEGGWSRTAAYRWLSSEMGYEFHFGDATLDECEQAIRVVEAKLEEVGLNGFKKRKAAEILAAIADAFDANELDDEARKFWGPNLEHENKDPPDKIVLYSGRGGKKLLTLADCLAARIESRGGKS